MASAVVIPVLVTGMLLTGVCNTLLTKYQDLQCVKNCDDPEKMKMFEQPIVQTLQMFIGEMGCWLIVAGYALYNRFFSKRREYTAIAEDEGDDTNPALKPLLAKEDRVAMKGKAILLLALPSTCDIAGTTLMNVGLLFVAASIYQMTRGALVLFVGLFSVWFLRRRLHPYQWFALVVVVSGVAVVGLAGAIAKNPQALPVQPEPHSSVAVRLFSRAVESAKEGDDLAPAVKTVLGVLMIAFAQIFTATQFVLEEHLLEKYSMEPLKLVGWEGIFGFIVTFVAQIILHFAVGRTAGEKHDYFDAVEGWRQITQYKAIAVSSILIMISIGGFNFFGLSVTRTISATSRSTIDTCRTLFIWIVSLALHWETFKWLQIIGFILLVYGTFLFNDLVAAPTADCFRKREKAAPLLVEEPIEHM